jgi:FAD/FMN-containing dehydrogenase
VPAANDDATGATDAAARHPGSPPAQPRLAADAQRALRDVAGAAALREHAPIDVDGTSLAFTVEPPDADAVGSVLRVLAERGLPVLVRGGGSRLGFGNPPIGARLLLSTRALAGIEEFDAAEGVLCAGAGTPLRTLHDALDDSVWELPLDAPGSGSAVCWRPPPSARATGASADHRTASSVSSSCSATDCVRTAVAAS